MRYAIFSDIHGNLPAWERVLADIRSAEADVLVCLGDVVGYGPKPQEVLDGIRAVTNHFVLGNHDAAAVGIIDPAIFNDHAHAVVLWTREALSQESLQFLSQITLELETPDILFVHAEGQEPGRFGYIDNEIDAAANFEARDHFVTFVGHTHHPECFERLPAGKVRKLGDQDQTLNSSCRYIINVGSVGEPRNPEDIRARYVLYDDDTRQVYFRRIEFDAGLYQAQLRATTLAHTPYFLQVLENQVAASAEGHDMKVLTQAVSGAATKGRTLHIPEAGTKATANKPKPGLSHAKKGSRKAVSALAVTSIILLGGLLYWFQIRGPKDSASSADSDQPKVNSRADAIARVESALASEAIEEPGIPDAADLHEAVDLPNPVFAIDTRRPITWNKLVPRNRNWRPKPVRQKPANQLILHFDGKDDFLHSKPVLDAGDDTFTYIALFKPLRLTKNQVIFEQAGKGDGARASLQLIGNRFRFSGHHNDSISLGTVEGGKWQLVAMVLNGKPDYNLIAIHNDSPPVTATIDMEKQKLGNHGLRVGMGTFAKSEHFKGQIGCIEVYDQALSTAQLKKRLARIQEIWGLKFALQIPEIEVTE